MVCAKAVRASGVRAGVRNGRFGAAVVRAGEFGELDIGAREAWSGGSDIEARGTKSGILSQRPRRR